MFKTTFQLLSMILCFNSLKHANAHSWIHCVDYDPLASLSAGSIQNSKCKAFARGIPNTAIFGEDRGYNYQPTRDIACRNSYNGNFYTLSKDKTIRMLWPAKNHIAASCTNPYITDQSLRLYLFPVNDLSSPDPSFSTWTNQKYLFYDFKRDGKGFQNCPDACPTIDRLPCYGDVYFPTLLASGYYKALWVWIFNPNERFTHCFDLQLTSSVPPTRPPTAKAPTTKAPTKAPTAKTPTAKVPTLQPVSNGCAALYQQCGGRNWKGTTCCITGVCKVQSPYYSQCVP